jgi:hypothetical protein
MLSCKDISKLLSDRLDRRLGLMQRLQLRMHLLMCSGCARVERHLGFLREAFSGLVKPSDRD